MKLVQDNDRLKALRATRLLDSAPSPAFDRLTNLAAKLLGSPVALISLVDGDRQFFKSTAGSAKPWAGVRETPLSHSICQHVVETGRPLVVNDARRDPLLRDNLAVRDFNLVSYLGVPLRRGGEHTLGAFCVIDTQPREWQPGEVGLVSELAQSVLSEIELHVKLAEQHDSLARFQLWFDHMPLASLTCDANCRITGWNPAAVSLFGYRPEQAIGALPHELLFAPEHHAAVVANIQNLIAHNRIKRCHRPARAADGREVVCEWTLTALRQADGTFDGLIATAEDITSKIRAQQRHEQLETQLRQAEKLNDIGRLAGGVAHDFNNILSIIQAQVDLLRLEGPLNPDLNAAVTELQDASRRGANLTRQLMLFGRQHVTRMRELDLNEATRNMTLLVRRLLREDIHAEFNFAHESLVIRADAGMLDQIIMNLVVNAQDAMATGGRLIVETAAVEFPENATTPARGGKFACLTVQDTGCGIPSEVLPRIFEPFFTTKDSGKGTGLGLATVQRIVKQHEGWVEIESQVGQGTTMRVYFPRDIATLVPDIEPETGKFLGGKETILLVEDYQALQQVVEKQLQRLGYKVLCATNGEEARRRWREAGGAVDLLLTDMRLPGGSSGRDIATELRAERPELKVIFLTGYSDLVPGRDFELVPGMSFLAKPCTLQVLTKSIRTALD